MQDAATAAHGSPIDDLVLGGGTKPVWAARPDGVKTQDLFASLRPGRKAADHSTREGYGPDPRQLEPARRMAEAHRGSSEGSMMTGATPWNSLRRLLANWLVEAAIRDAIRVHCHRDRDGFGQPRARNRDDVISVKSEQEEVSPRADDANPLPRRQGSHIGDEAVADSWWRQQ